jgi:hypothetical protein
MICTCVKYHSKTSLNNQYTILKMKDKRVKQVMPQVGWRKDEEEQLWLMNFVYQYENRTIKLVTICSKRGKGDEAE